MDEVINFFRGIVPTPLEYFVGGAISCAGTIFCYFFGCWDRLIETLLAAMILDYATGVIAAWLNPGKKLDSRKGFAGILKKVMILLIVATAHLIDYATGQVLIRSIVILFFLGNEGLSIIENAANAGVPVPEKLKDTLEQFTKNEEE